MTLTNPSPECRHSSLGELSAIEAVIAATQNYLEVTKRRRDELTAEFNGTTASSPATTGTEPHEIMVQCPSLNMISHRRGYDYRGKTVRCREKKDIWVGVMQAILDDFPDKHADIVKALKLRERTRSFISKDRMTLFLDKNRDWVTTHSTMHQNGWYVDKNLQGERIRSLLETVVDVVGLSWGKDVTVRLNSQRAR